MKREAEPHASASSVCRVPRRSSGSTLDWGAESWRSGGSHRTLRPARPCLGEFVLLCRVKAACSRSSGASRSFLMGKMRTGRTPERGRAEPFLLTPRRGDTAASSEALAALEAVPAVPGGSEPIHVEAVPPGVFRPLNGLQERASCHCRGGTLGTLRPGFDSRPVCVHDGVLPPFWNCQATSEATLAS